MADYVKNADLREEIIKSKAQDKLTDKAVTMLMLIAHKYSMRFNYKYEEDREDCIAVAIMDCYQYWRGYDPEVSANAFAYYSQIIKNGFFKSYRKTYGQMPKSSKISLSYNIYNL